MKKFIIVAITAIGIVAGLFYWMKNASPKNDQNLSLDYKNISYEIDGKMIQLKDGTSETEAAPGSIEKITTQYFGNEARGDFNNDGTEDVAFILTQYGGGTGTFYYVVAALKTLQGYRGTNGILLGDRIAPQTTEFQDGEIIVNYADRKPGEPFSIDPSVGVSLYLKVNNNELVEIQR